MSFSSVFTAAIVAGFFGSAAIIANSVVEKTGDTYMTLGNHALSTMDGYSLEQCPTSLGMIDEKVGKYAVLCSREESAIYVVATNNNSCQEITRTLAEDKKPFRYIETCSTGGGIFEIRL